MKNLFLILITSLLTACSKNDIKPTAINEQNIMINKVEEVKAESDIKRSEMDLSLGKIEQIGHKIYIEIKMGGCEDKPRLSFYKRKILPNVRYSYDFFHIRFQTSLTCERLNTYILVLDTKQINFASKNLKIKADNDEKFITIN